MEKVLTKNGVVHRIPLVDLGVWLFRGQEFPDGGDARSIEQKFRKVFPTLQEDYDRLFEFHGESAANIFTPEKPSDVAYRVAIEGALLPSILDISRPLLTPASTDPDKKVESLLDDDDFVLTEVKRLLAFGTSGIILRGCPGTSKTWYANQIAKSLVKKSSHIFKVQFHPSYGYEDFVEGYRPNEETKSGFEIIAKVFLNACDVAAKLKEKTPVVFIIDEINRGDPSRIFGELLTYIEHGYRGDKFSLSYTGKSAAVPPNLVILGTMNQHDKSVTQLDVALVRRFDHIGLDPSSEILQEFLEKSEGFESEQIDRIVKWFEALQQLLPYGIGHTYFKDVKTPEQLQTIWRYRILPFCESVLELESDKLESVRKSFEGMYKAVIGQGGDGA